MNVPIANPEISEQSKAAVVDVLDSGRLADGDVVRSFEAEFADYVGTEHAIATSSGTTALHAMVEAAGIGPQDAVVTTPFSFVSTANAVVHAGAEPVFADIDERTFNLSPSAVEDVLRERDDIAAIMPVHLYGLPAEMDAFRELADTYDVRLFEDAAQAHGATYGGQQVGSLGDVGAFSFYPTKNMTTGEGGMVVTDSDSLAESLRSLVDHGRTGRYKHDEVGYNYRMTNIAAAIGRDQLNRLPDWVDRRREIANELTERFADVESVQTPVEPSDRRHAYHQYTVRVDDRETVVDQLETDEIGYGIYYPETIPAQPAYGLEERYPVAESATDEVLSLPVHPNVEDTNVTQITDSVLKAVEP